MKGANSAHVSQREGFSRGELLLLAVFVGVSTVAMFLGLWDLFHGFLTLVRWVNQQ